ncbi:MAG: electron transport complex subunit E [Clostridia bacterium]|nr:electron transport complex subunit E [Clostridia bacterium]
MAKEKKMNIGKEFSKGIISDNPVFRLVLGTCPSLAVSTSLENALGMGIAASFVLICSNVVISALRKVIPDKVRIPAFIVVIATFVSIVQMVVQAFAPALNDALGIYLPLIVVNCILLGRAEAYASKNPVFYSAIDGLGMGFGFTIAIALMAIVREIFGAGTLTLKLLGKGILLDFNPYIARVGLEPILIFILAPGGFFVFGILMALFNKIAESKGKQKAELGCAGCPMSKTCASCETNNDKKVEVASK